MFHSTVENSTITAAVVEIPWLERARGSAEILWRDDRNPIIGRNPLPFANSVYNSAVVRHGDGFKGVFRVDYRTGLPFLHAGSSPDGIHWEIETPQIDLRDEEGNAVELGFGYDPRVTPIENGYVVAWCNDFNGPTVALAYTEDFVLFKFLGNTFVPFNRNGVLFPRKINGLYTLLHRPSDAGHTPFGDIFLSQSPDLKFWGEHKHVMGPTEAWWDNKKIGGGPVPIETSEGWLIIYHGVMGTCNGYNYSIGAALLDIDEPWKVIARANQYLLGPEADYETVGRVANVCFPCAALTDAAKDRIAVYYGAADTHTALAYGHISEIIEFVKTNNCV
jgi:beta-1,4-mannooligosaccharide/beta-1,4-mannosyl-N-acetylglucosamine phosphorylase